MARIIIYTGGAGPRRIKAGGIAFEKGKAVPVSDDDTARKLLSKRFFIEEKTERKKEAPVKNIGKEQ